MSDIGPCARYQNSCSRQTHIVGNRCRRQQHPAGPQESQCAQSVLPPYPPGDCDHAGLAPAEVGAAPPPAPSRAAVVYQNLRLPTGHATVYSDGLAEVFRDSAKGAPGGVEFRWVPLAASDGASAGTVPALLRRCRRRRRSSRISLADRPPASARARSSSCTATPCRPRPRSARRPADAYRRAALHEPCRTQLHAGHARRRPRAAAVHRHGRSCRAAGRGRAGGRPAAAELRERLRAPPRDRARFRPPCRRCGPAPTSPMHHPTGR